MPKTTPATDVPNGKAWNKDTAPKYVRCELTPDNKAALALWAEDQEDMDMIKWLEAHVVSGHVVSIRSNDVGYQVSLTGVREGSGHVGLSLVARASTPLRALYSCWYKDEVLLKGTWPVSSAVADLDF